MSTPWNQYLETYGIDRGQFPITLTGSSANCKSTILQTKTKRHFVKCQVDSFGDDIMNDNINNVLLQHYLVDKSNVAELIDSFQVPVSAQDELLKDETDSFVFLGANIQKAIDGIEASHLPPTEFETIKFKNALYDLFKNVFLNLGSKYGFSHNDAHLGNIMVVNDGPNYKLVLIDYGRCLFKCFETKVFPDGTQGKINQYFTKLGRRAYSSSISSSVCSTPARSSTRSSAASSAPSSANQFDCYSLLNEESHIGFHENNYWLDISTITMNILTKKHEGEIFTLKNPSGEIVFSLSYTRFNSKIKTFEFEYTHHDETASMSDNLRVLMTKCPGNIYAVGVYIFIKFLDTHVKTWYLYSKYYEPNNPKSKWKLEFYDDTRTSETMLKYIYYNFQYFMPLNVNINSNFLTTYLESCSVIRQVKTGSGKKGGLAPPIKSSASKSSLNAEIQIMWSAYNRWINQNDNLAFATFKAKQSVDFSNYHKVARKVKQCLHLLEYSHNFKKLVDLALNMMNACNFGICSNIEEYFQNFDKIVKEIPHKHIMLCLDTPPKKSSNVNFQEVFELKRH